MQNCRFCNSARIILAILAHICISVLHIIAEFRIAELQILQFCYSAQIILTKLAQNMYICSADYYKNAELQIFVIVYELF